MEDDQLAQDSPFHRSRNGWETPAAVTMVKLEEVSDSDEDEVSSHVVSRSSGQAGDAGCASQQCVA